MPPKKKSKTEEGEEVKGEEEVEETKEKKEEKEEKEVKEEEAKAEDEAKEESKEDEAKVKEEETPKEPEKPKELEEDAPEDTRPKIKGGVTVSEVDTTLDVVLSGGGSILTSFSNGAFQHLLSGARATVGCKSGRYLFEMKILERKGEANLRFGLSTANGSLFLGEGKGKHIFYEAQDSWKGKVVGILVNLDESSPNAFTTSLFMDGVRAKPPKPIPEELKGSVLFPTFTFRNLTLACNFGQTGGPMKPLPFKVPMFSAMAQADSGKSDFSKPSGGNEVVVVVGLPDEGVFDFADKFLQDNPTFTELSNRSLMKWCERSGLRQNHRDNTSRDQPNFNFQIEAIDKKGAMWGVINTLAKFSMRNYLVVEVVQSLQKETREQILQKFSAPFFTKKAIVCVGEPPADFKSWVHKTIMEKYEKDKERKQAAIEKQKAKAAGKGKKRTADGEVKEEEKKEEEKDEKPIIPEPETGPDVWFVPKPKAAGPDVSKKVIASCFSKFCFPTTEEGFSKVTYAWQNETTCAEHLRKWQLDKKATMIIQDLKVSDWFKEKLKAFTEPKKEWKKKQVEWKQKQKKDGKKTDDDEEGDDIDLSTITDVNEDANGMPVYARFQHEDWTLLQWRCDMHLLAHGFVHDVDDPDRPGVPEEHIGHYMKLYLGQNWNPKGLGCEDLPGVCNLLKDTVCLSGEKTKVLNAKLPEATTVEDILKLVEETRRSRVRRIEAGDESARLKIPKSTPEGKSGGSGKGQGKDYRKGEGKSSSKGFNKVPLKRPIPTPPATPSKWQRTDSWGGGKSGGRSGSGYQGGGYSGGYQGSGGKSSGKQSGSSTYTARSSFQQKGGGYGKGGGSSKGRYW